MADGGALVAFLAGHRGVSAEQREAVLVVLDLLHGDLPAEYGVTLRAIRTKFAPVNIRMAVRAILSDIGENWLCMTLGAFHLFVHAAQRVTRFVVIEFGNGSNGPPTRGGVAVFARNRQGTMRAPGGLPLREGRRNNAREHEEQHERARELMAPERNYPLTLELHATRGAASLLGINSEL